MTLSVQRAGTDSEARKQADSGSKTTHESF